MKYNYIDSSNENGINFIDEPLINSLINENIEEDPILCREIFAKTAFEPAGYGSTDIYQISRASE